MLEFSPPPDFVNAQKLISGFGSPVDSTGVRRPDLLVDVRGGGPPWGHFQASVHSAKLAWDVCVTVDSAHIRARRFGVEKNVGYPLPVFSQVFILRTLACSALVPARAPRARYFLST